MVSKLNLPILVLFVLPLLPMIESSYGYYGSKSTYTCENDFKNWKSKCSNENYTGFKCFETKVTYGKGGKGKDLVYEPICGFDRNYHCPTYCPASYKFTNNCSSIIVAATKYWYAHLIPPLLCFCGFMIVGGFCGYTYYVNQRSQGTFSERMEQEEEYRRGRSGRKGKGKGKDMDQRAFKKKQKEYRERISRQKKEIKRLKDQTKKQNEALMKSKDYIGKIARKLEQKRSEIDALRNQLHNASTSSSSGVDTDSSSEEVTLEDEMDNYEMSSYNNEYGQPSVGGGGGGLIDFGGGYGGGDGNDFGDSVY